MTREEEIKKELNNYFIENSQNSFPCVEKYLNIALELVDILENKIIELDKQILREI